jgi:hypothetical protein
MYLVTTNAAHDLLILTFLERVVPEELKTCRREVTEILAGLQPGFRLLTDLSHLEAMDFSCANDIRAIMDLIHSRGVSRIVRVIPNRRKDIGFTTMSYFHYGPDIGIVTVETLAEGLGSLA